MGAFAVRSLLAVGLFPQSVFAIDRRSDGPTDAFVLLLNDLQALKQASEEALGMKPQCWRLVLDLFSLILQSRTELAGRFSRRTTD